MNASSPHNVFAHATRSISSVLFCFGLMTGNALACNGEGDTCLFAVFPHSSMRQIESTYGPIAEELGLVIDRQVQLLTARSYLSSRPGFVEASKDDYQPYRDIFLQEATQ